MNPHDVKPLLKAVDRRQGAVCVAVVVAVAVSFLLTTRPGHGWGGDFAQYLQHARNIAELKPYGATGYVYNPLRPELGPRGYPPVFPLFLSATYKIRGLDLEAFKTSLVLVFAASLLVTARLFSEDLGAGRTIVYLILAGACPIFWQMKDRIWSEHLFILLWYTSILVADAWYRRGKVYRSESVHAVALGALIYLTFGTRAVGVVLLPAVLVCEWSTARRLTRFGVLAISTAAVPILLQKTFLPVAGQGYAEVFGRLNPETVLQNAVFDAGSLSFVWDNGFLVWIQVAAGVLFSIVALVAFVRRNLPRPSFLGAAMVLYFAVVVLWPGQSGLRMVIPLLPGYMFYVLLGLRFDGAPQTVGRAVLACYCLFTAVSYAGWYSRADYGPIDGVETPVAVELFDFVRGNTHESEVCLFFKPRVLALYADRQAICYPPVGDEARLWEFVKAANISVLIAREDAGRDAEAMVTNGLTGLVEVWRNEGFGVFRREVGNGRAAGD